MSTDESDALEPTPTWLMWSNACDGSCRRDRTYAAKKIPVPPARGEQVPSDLSLGWLHNMLTEDNQHVNR